MSASRPRASVVCGTAAIDVVLVLVFVAIGRSSHDEGFTVPGLLQTWWPFLAGLAIGWLVTAAWRRPIGLAWPGIPVWIVTVGVGMLLRVASAQGIELAFVIVAGITLGVFLLGWRAVAGLVIRMRERRTA